ncbi:MAG: thiaminase II [Synergistaceae bacterium]|jgi:thiaminase/transcriptional activator TenA|nr:thiaminase II [Synergistaceae bacterium]
MSFSRSLKEYSRVAWEDGYRHPFVRELGRGTLARERFKFYMLQDYKYLLSYAGVFALGALKSDTEYLMSRFTYSQNKILNGEMDIHRAYMRELGISASEIASAKPSLYNRAYTSNMLAAGHDGGVAEIIAVIFPCAWTYHDYATRLAEDYSGELEGNFYRPWIEGYASDDFRKSFEWFYDALDEACQYKSEAELERIRELFASSVEFEYLFWDMSYDMRMSYKMAPR